MASRKLEVKIVGDASNLNKAFGQAGSSASGFGSKMAKVGKIAAVGLAAGVGLAAIAAVKFAKAALDAEKSQTRLDSAFKHAGASAKEQAAALKRVSDVSNQAGLDDEALADSLARLTQVTGDVTKAQNAMALAADVARGRGISLEAATQLVTKAAIGNVGALKRMGIAIPAVTTAVDALKESNKKATSEQMAAAKAADLVSTKQAALAALQSKFGGDAEAYGKTASGAMDRFKVAIENVEEGLGAALLPTLGRVAGGVADFLTKFNQAEGASAKFKVLLDSIKKLATDAWSALKTAVGNIQWGQIWDTVKTKIASVDWNATAKAVGDKLVVALNQLSTAIGRVDWNKVGAAIGEGIKKGAAMLASVNWGSVIVGYMKLQARLIQAVAKVLVALGDSLLSGLLDVIQKAASSAGAWAAGIGSAVAAGIVSGIGDLASSFAGAVIGKLSAAKDRVLSWAGIKSPSTLFASEVGSPIALGIAMGVTMSGAKISEALQKSLENAMERAKQVMEAKRASFGAAWDTFAGAAGSAFDAVYDKIQTKSEKALAKLQKTEQEAGLKGAITDARSGLSDAQAGGDQAAIVAAQKQLDDALRAQQEYTLQQRAIKERLELDATIARKKENFGKQLLGLQNHLAKEGATQRQAHTALMKLFDKFGLDYEKSGAALGQAFADGLKSKVKAVEAAAVKLAEAASRPIRLQSPAEVGPLSQLDSFWKSFVPTLTSGLDFGGLGRAVSGAVSFPSAAPSFAGGGGQTINVTVNGWVGNDQDIAARIQQELIRTGRRNTSIFSGPGVSV